MANIVVSSLFMMVVLLLIVLVMASTVALGDDKSSLDSKSEEHICKEQKDDAENDHDTTETDRTKELPIWWDYDIDQLFEDYFDCGSILYGYDVDDNLNDLDDKDVPKRNKAAESDNVVSDAQLQTLKDQWKMMREKYIHEVNLVPLNPDAATTSAIVVPSRIGDAGRNKGRGVFATESIPKDALIIDLDNGNTGIFKLGHSWREFAATLPREMACNFIEWSWVQTLMETPTIDDVRNGLTVFISFDESNLMNNAAWDGVDANVRCGSPPKHMGEEWGPCRFHYYAARDITAGEELLLHYADFEDVSQQGWVEIGLSEGRQEEEEVVYEDGDYLIDEGDEYNNNDDDNTDDDNHNDENGL